MANLDTVQIPMNVQAEEPGSSNQPKGVDDGVDAGAPHIIAMSFPGSLPQQEDKPGLRRRAASHAELRAVPAEATANLLKMVVQIQQQLAEGAQRQILFEADVLKRIDEAKTFSIQSAKKLLDDPYDRILHGIDVEFKEGERLKIHFRGHDAPVIEAILDELLAPTWTSA